jgi:hypothetical protein
VIVWLSSTIPGRTNCGSSGSTPFDNARKASGQDHYEVLLRPRIKA